MSAHVYNRWDWTHEINSEIVQDIAEAIRRNKWGDNYCPPCFAVLTIGDQIVFNLGGTIDRASKNTEAITTEILQEKIPEDFEYRDKAIELCILVLKKLEMFDVPLERGRVSKEEATKDMMKNYSVTPDKDPGHFGVNEDEDDGQKKRT